MSDTLADKFSDQLLRNSQQPSASSANSVDDDELEDGELADELDVDVDDEDDMDEDELMDEDDEDEWSTADGDVDVNDEFLDGDAASPSRLAELEGLEIEEGDEAGASSASAQ